MGYYKQNATTLLTNCILKSLICINCLRSTKYYEAIYASIWTYILSDTVSDKSTHLGINFICQLSTLSQKQESNTQSQQMHMILSGTEQQLNWLDMGSPLW